MAAVTGAALSAPQSALQSPEPLGTRNCTRSALHGAYRTLPYPSAPSLIGLGAHAPRMTLGAMYSLEPAVRARKHAEASTGASATLLAGSAGFEESEP